MLRFAFSITLISSALAATPALMPLPVTVRLGTGKLILDKTFRAALVSAPDTRLKASVGRFVERLSRQTGIPMLGLGNAAPKLRVECAGAGSEYPVLGEDESYTLDVTSEGAVLKAPTRAGALHGLGTFGQLVTLGPGGFEVPAVHIEDKPRFPWRGLMMDSARHFMPLEVVKRNLDAMAAVKLNVFHWHLADDQGFRVESTRFPKLHQEGSDGLFYTQDEIRSVVAYARDRGIRVVPEFDIPGHTTAWLVGYPELGTNPGPYEIGRKWGVYENALDPSREETYAFLDTFFEEMTALFPDRYFHIGGDEVEAKQWNASARVQTFAKQNNLKDAHAIQAYFNQRVQKLLQKRGKIVIGWDEVLHPDLPRDIVVQSWQGQKSLAEAAAKGYRGILSWGYYLDHLRPAAFHYGVDPMAADADSLGQEQRSRILGGEMCMWAEYVTAETVDSRIWPRAAAIAERLWSPAASRDLESMYARMEAVSRVLEWTGVQHRANYAPMLERLTGGRPSEPLRVLADAVEGLGLGPRARAGKYTSLTPMNRLADAARPESESVRALELAAAKVAANPKGSLADAAALRREFSRWAANDARFQELAAENPLLAELKPLSRDLAALGNAGLKLLDALEKGQAPAAAFVAEQTRGITRMEKPAAEVNLAATRPVKVLLKGGKK
ncbi:MAG: family 20 glycosylhydrolase [Candidatus Solibacter sp.]|nr:family 20 glycosylhydrolase [Candidatus Solibacter sp.]